MGDGRDELLSHLHNTREQADYRTRYKVGVQSCKVYVKPEEDAAYYVINKVSGKLEL